MRPVREIRVPGFRGGGAACGIKKTGKPDLAVVASDAPCVSDVVFTRNRVFAAPSRGESGCGLAVPCAASSSTAETRTRAARKGSTR